jgi:hypothetical protein
MFATLAYQFVIPAKAGIHVDPDKWIPAFAGMTYWWYLRHREGGAVKVWRAQTNSGASRAAALLANPRFDPRYFIARVTHSSETFLL